MNPDLREAIGRAAYEAALGDDMEIPWDKLTEAAKEVNRKSAEAAVEAYKQWISHQAPQVVSWPGRGDV